MFKKINRKNKKGFTLAELLIVVAIIGVLVAISIPIFTSQLEKAREATDASNIRAAYAEIASAALTDSDTAKSATINKKQTKDGWQSASGIKDIAGVGISSINSTKATVVAYGGKDDPKITIDGTEVTSTFVS